VHKQTKDVKKIDMLHYNEDDQKTEDLEIAGPAAIIRISYSSMNVISN
jgi:hypothetical protein